MTRLRSAWRSYWFPAVPVRRLSAFRLVVCAFVLVDVTVLSSYMTRYASVDGTFYEPILLLEMVGLPRAGAGVTEAVHVLLIVVAVLGLVGLMTRVALWVLAPLYLWWFATFVSFGAIQHGRITMIFALTVLAIAPAGGAYSLDAVIARARRAVPGWPLPAAADARDELAGWALRVMTVIIACAYFFAGYAKLVQSGPGWATGGALESVIVEMSSPLGMMIGGQQWLMALMGVSALLLECSAVLLLVAPRRVRYALLGSLTGFHAGTFVLLRINFLPYVLTYAAFFRLERGAAWLGSKVRGLAGRLGAPVAVRYDGGCRMCVRTITALGALDWLGRLRFVDATATLAGPLEAMEADDGRRTESGYRAFRRIAWCLPVLWPALALAYLPGVPRAGDRSYAYFAARRTRTGACGVDGCALPWTADSEDLAAGRTADEQRVPAAALVDTPGRAPVVAVDRPASR